MPLQVSKVVPTSELQLDAASLGENPANEVAMRKTETKKLDLNATASNMSDAGLQLSYLSVMKVFSRFSTLYLRES